MANEDVKTHAQRMKTLATTIDLLQSVGDMCKVANKYATTQLADQGTSVGDIYNEVQVIMDSAESALGQAIDTLSGLSFEYEVQLAQGDHGIDHFVFSQGPSSITAAAGAVATMQARPFGGFLAGDTVDITGSLSSLHNIHVVVTSNLAGAAIAVDATLTDADDDSDNLLFKVINRSI